ncbi:MAG: hypothetical protein ACXABY_17085, partial [Candidatus Thorarchaeota archaeon]
MMNNHRSITIGLTLDQLKNTVSEYSDEKEYLSFLEWADKNIEDEVYREKAKEFHPFRIYLIKKGAEYRLTGPG